MKAIINLASLIVVATVLTGCGMWNSGCCNPCEPKCCPAPRIWENNNSCCEPSGY